MRYKAIIMNNMKISILALAICAGLTSAANATLSDPIPFNSQPDNPTQTLADFKSVTGNTDATACIPRVDGDRANGDIVTSGAFTFTFHGSGGGPVVDVTFDLTNTPGQLLCGFYIKGGNAGGNFYTVSADEGLSGTFLGLHAPITGRSGKFADISHIDTFCCPGGNNVPDGGTTAMLLGSALTGLGVVRRYIKR